MRAEIERSGEGKEVIQGEGDATHAIGLWDAETKCNEEPGLGEHRASRQFEVGTWMAEDASVRLITDMDDGYSYPYVSEVIRVTREVEMG